ncbi:Solanesyl diphosphate synthase 1, chloroplastic [Linum perenne]
MASLTCHNLTTMVDVVSSKRRCSCWKRLDSSVSIPIGFNRGIHRSGSLVASQLDFARCRSVSTKSADAQLTVPSEASSEVLLNVERGQISLTKLFEVVAEDLLILNQNLKSIVGAENPVLMSAAEQIFGAGGKRMRPALVFLVSRATAQMSGLKLVLHNLHFGKETVHQLYGTRVAVLAGDFMFAQSSWYLANLENLEVIKLISQVIKDFASGEIKQASNLFDCDIELDEYLIKSYYKTASLVAASTKGAAIFSEVDSTIAKCMFEYGKNLGLSFQVIDDILDFTQSAEQLGKPAGSDLAKGILTAPAIFALEREPKLREIIESEFCEEGSLQEAIELVKRSEGIQRAQKLAREKADIAIQNLECLPQSTFRSALEQMVLYNLERIE